MAGGTTGHKIFTAAAMRLLLRKLIARHFHGWIPRLKLSPLWAMPGVNWLGDLSNGRLGRSRGVFGRGLGSE